MRHHLRTSLEHTLRLWLAPVGIAVTLLRSQFAASATSPKPGPIRFNQDIRPILADNCLQCHGPDKAKRKAKLDLDTHDGLFTSRENRTPVTPHKPDQSELVRRITASDPDEIMPPAKTGKTLTPSQVGLIRRWIEEGAPWEGHWSFTPPTRPALPSATDKSWVRNPIDRFVLARLRAEKLHPAQEADPRTLIRRLSFDLTGLPPKASEVEAFVKDHGSRAYTEAVEALLGSPHFGERMALYWLDLVRYSDTDGFHADNYRSVWPYRDYVIRAFNQNLPFNQFTLEQIAGDLLPNPTLDQRTASTYNRLNRTTEEGGAQAKDYLAKYAADRVRTTSVAWLGATFGCAECHDHKFDPYSTRDFYSFEAFFADVQEVGVGKPEPVLLPDEKQSAELKSLDAQLVRLQSVLDTTTPELASAQTAWEQALLSQPLPAESPWQWIGPFSAESYAAAFNTAFPPETEVELGRTYAEGKLKWTPRPDWADGVVHGDLMGENAAHYLFRVLTADRAQSLSLSLGSDDAIKLWINGKEVLAHDVQRGVAPDQEKVTIDLRAGENRLLMKIVNAAAGSGFYFSPGTGVPENILAIVKTPTVGRKPEQETELGKYYRATAPSLAATRAELEATKKRRAEFVAMIPTTLATVAVAPRPIRILPRGNWMDETGEIVLPGVPQALGRLQPGGERATRLDLARWLVSEKNPLTARVFVNRLWKMFYGTGLSKTVDDLGTRGEWPSHPELLDWLAVEFVDSGWDVKHLVRLMVGSSTYRQTSQAGPGLRERDPENRLLARQSSFRLDAELVRDNALAVSGLLNDTVGGPSVKPYQPAGYWDFLNFPKRTWEADHGQALYRRGLYTFWCRTFLQPSLLAFDAPSREECTAARIVSNTPLQALALLNDPSYVEAARALAEQIASQPEKAVEPRVRWAFSHTVGRPAGRREVSLLSDLQREELMRYSADPDASARLTRVGEHQAPENRNTAELAAWTAVSRTLLNLHETITRY